MPSHLDNLNGVLASNIGSVLKNKQNARQMAKLFGGAVNANQKDLLLSDSDSDLSLRTDESLEMDP